MKELITAAFIALALPVCPAAPDPDNPTNNDVCTAVGEVAYKLMRARQRGDDPGEHMKMVEGKEIYEQMVLDAWEHQRYQHPDNQTIAMQDFRTRHYLACMQALTKRDKRDKRRK